MGTPISTRSRRCSPRAASIPAPSSPSGALNRNVRDFYRLHAEELDAVVEISRLELDAIRRLIVIETTNASRLGELEQVALDAVGREGALRPSRRGGAPRLGRPGSAVLSDDGALTTTLVGILAERELLPTPLEATTFALGIHEDTGSLTYATSTQRDADALAWCLRHGARQDLVSAYLHAPLAAAERDLLNHLLEELEPLAVGGEEVLLAAVRWPEYVEGVSILAHKIVDLTDTKALVLLVEMDERVFAVVRSRSDDLDASVVASALGGGGHAQAASAIAAKRTRRSPCARRLCARAGPPGASTRPGRHVHASAVGLAGGKGARRDGALPAARAERGLRRR